MILFDTDIKMKHCIFVRNEGLNLRTNGGLLEKERYVYEKIR